MTRSLLSLLVIPLLACGTTKKETTVAAPSGPARAADPDLATVGAVLGPVVVLSSETLGGQTRVATDKSTVTGNAVSRYLEAQLVSVVAPCVPPPSVDMVRIQAGGDPSPADLKAVMEACGAGNILWARTSSVDTGPVTTHGVHSFAVTSSFRWMDAAGDLRGTTSSSNMIPCSTETLSAPECTSLFGRTLVPEAGKRLLQMVVRTAPPPTAP